MLDGKVTSLTGDQAWFAQRCVAEWMRICGENNRSCSPADATHSSLLARLLSGGKALPKPPPKSHSYPNYELGEGNPAEIMEIWEKDNDVCIDQSLTWRWIDKEKGLLFHVPSEEKYRYWTEVKYRKIVHGKIIELEPYNAKMLQKIQQEEIYGKDTNPS
jgi:hypothetical protein